jgi:hypothetical protein
VLVGGRLLLTKSGRELVAEQTTATRPKRSSETTVGGVSLLL